MPIYLGFDSSTQGLTAMAVDVRARQVIWQHVLTYDEALPEYGTRRGVLPSDTPSVAASSPLMWADALDRMRDRCPVRRAERAEGPAHGEASRLDELADGDGCPRGELRTLREVPDAGRPPRAGRSAEDAHHPRGGPLEPERLVTMEDKKASVEMPGAKPDDEPVKKEIEVGLSDGLNLEVIAGLEAGDKVVQRPAKEVE